MIFGLLHKGSGLGNQLHRYVGTKIIAMEKGEPHSMIAPELFKGKDFMKLDIEPNDIKYTIKEPSGEVVPESYEGVLDQEFQGEADFIRHLDKVREWLKTPSFDMADDLCIINFRGGEYKYVPDLYLPQEYWDRAIAQMREINPAMRFEVHTDDPVEARKFFEFPIVSGMPWNWQSIRYAKYLILSNSSFAILPALMGDAKEIIAPKFWAGYNKGYWQREDNQYARFTYI